MTQTETVAGGRLADWISLGVLASAVPRDAVDDAIEVTGKAAKRSGGKLPPHVMAYFAMVRSCTAGDFTGRLIRQGTSITDGSTARLAGGDLASGDGECLAGFGLVVAVPVPVDGEAASAQVVEGVVGAGGGDGGGRLAVRRRCGWWR